MSKQPEDNDVLGGASAQNSELENLGNRIQKTQAQHQESDISTRNKEGGAFQVASDLLAGVVVGCVIGYFLDKVLETSPIFFIVSSLLGIAAGFLNVYRSVTKN
jgi:ATP synthase protein I